MSVSSDDTDVLLLIPPDFFLIPSDSDEELPKKSASESIIVSDLISQVNDLEGRICLIENRCLNEGAMTGNLQQLRHYGSLDTLNYSSRSCFNTRSLQATPNKNGFSPWKYGEHSPLKRAQFPLEMRENILTSCEYITQKDKDEQLLKEIDQFFKHRRNTEEDSSEVTVLTKPESAQLLAAVSNLNKVNDLLKKLDETQKEIEDKVKLREVAEVETEDSLVLGSKALVEEEVTQGEKVCSGEVNNVKRILSFEDEEKKEDCKEVISNSEFNCGEDGCANAKAKLTEVSENKVESRKSQELMNLLSLSNLWGSSTNICKSDSQTEGDQILKQRLQEEKCRRQHCEKLIQQIQFRLLEEQQKVAVAMKVDQEKDQAISKLTEGWNKLVGHWRDLENQRNNLAKKLLSDREKFKTEISAAYHTVKRYEVELSKALDLAHGYKEKCEASEKEKKTLRASAAKEIESMRSEMREAVEKLRTEECKNEKLEKLLCTKEELANQGKAKLAEMQNNLREVKKTLKELQIESENLKIEKEKMGERLKEERSKVLILEQSKKSLQNQMEESKKREKILKDDIKLLTEQMEKVKMELKEFYQGQVECIVQEKLKEFQEQLTAAEKALQMEIEMREKTVTEMAVKQVQQLVEKHLMEVNVLEEKQKGELELCKLQLNQKDEKIKELQKKLEQYSSNKTLIAQKLHSVMEDLKIITSSSPQHIKSPPDSGRSQMEKSITRQNTFTMISAQETTSPSTPTIPFCQDGVLTFREELKNTEALTYRVNDVPQKIPSENLKKYIKVLLERAPGHPVSDSLDSNAYKCIETFSDESCLTQWQHVLSEPSSSQLISDVSKYSDSYKPSKEIKPPWK